jgi:regulation of enolase protein 1 (concanavalin A-like superfamily)
MNSKKHLIRIVFTCCILSGVSLISSAQTPKQVDEKKISSILFSDLKYLDIGTVNKKGTEKITKDELEMDASGSDIWGKHDEFHFGYMKLNGDFDLSVQVLSLSAANKYTKAGIMARTDLSDSSQHVYYQVFPDNSPRNKNNGGCEFQYRLVKGGDMKAVYPDPKTAGNLFNVAYPATWIRLRRLGNIFESYFSNDNKTWSLYTKFELKMPQELLVGLAVTAHDRNNFTKARFSSLKDLK